MPGIHISVITSLYRCTAFLQDFLLHYSRIKNIDECELILVHNDPTAEELDMINNFTQPRINLVHIVVKREGLYASWNRAIDAASGEYLAVWNVDDIRTPDSLLAQKNALEQTNAALSYGDFYGTRTYGPNADKLYQYPEYDRCIKEAFRRHIIGCFPMWRKTIHKELGYFDEQFRLVSDYEFQLRVIRRLPLAKAASVLGYYLEHAGHKLSSNRRVQRRERTAVQLRYHMFDKLLLHVLPFAFRYRLNHILSFGKWVPVRSILPSRTGINTGELWSLLRMPFTYARWFLKRSFQTLYNILFHKQHAAP
ncbi:glycosyltransferase [Puia sp.]|jgi:glycosyltransferase involved in cell wall biosynthesis|uniref:glycosyltransferase n=1 Tax=Puia sp. TaxID=2045100 RepID=UPI002F419761